MSVLGLDLSSTSTGWCLDGTCGVIVPKGDLHQRARQTRLAVGDVTLAPDLVVVEAIGTRHVQTAIALATVHALVLDYWDQWTNTPVVTVSPATLKKFATGKGNATKTQMVAAAIRCGWDGDGQDDACDAWWLYHMGVYLREPEIVRPTDYRDAAIRSIDWPVTA